MLELVLIIFNIATMIVIVFISKAIFKSKFNYLNIFIFWWLFNLSFAQINLLGFYEISLKSMLLFYIPVFITPLGCILANSVFRVNPITHIVQTKANTNNLTSYWVISLIVFVFTVFLIISSYLIASSQGVTMANLRSYILLNKSGETGLLARLIPIMWVVKGATLYILLSSIYNSFILDQKKFRLIILVSCFSLINLDLATGGRIIIVFLLFVFLTLYLLAKENGVIFVKPMKIRRLTNKIIMLSIVLILGTSALRNDSFNIIYLLGDYFIRYYTGPFTAFDQMIATDIISRYDEIRFGLTFLGLDSVVVSGFMRFIFGTDIASLMSLTSSVGQYGLDLKPGLRYNAFYTFLFPIYVDGGGLYIFIFSFILGIIFVSFARKFNKKLTRTRFLIHFMLMNFIFVAPRGNVLQEPDTFIFFGIVLFCSMLRSTKPK